MSNAMEAEYQGKAILILKGMENDKFPFQFGVRKAKLILSHLKEIEAFVVKHA